MKSKKLVAIITMTVLLSVGSITVHAKDYTTNRIGGQTRIETAVKIGENYTDEELSAVIVTTANDFPEALVGSTLSARYKAPILLVNQTVEGSEYTLNYIKNHLASDGTVYILGDTNEVTSDVETAIKDMGYSNINRIAGTTKDETLKLITDEVGIPQGTPVLIASQDNFPDALSASAIAGIKGYPIVICSNGSLSQSAIYSLQSIKPSTIYLIGGSAVVPDSVVKSVMNVTGVSSNNVIRLSGQDRYDTSLAIAKYFNLDTKNAIIASGDNFPDSLAGSSLAVKNNAPLILIGNEVSRQRNYLKNTVISNLLILGGEGVTTPAEVKALITDPPTTSDSSNSGGSTYREHGYGFNGERSGSQDDPNFHAYTP